MTLRVERMHGGVEDVAERCPDCKRHFWSSFNGKEPTARVGIEPDQLDEYGIWVR